MAITVVTGQPRGLLSAIKEAIDNETVRTWEYDGDGDFTHSAQQWNLKAWLRPRVREERLVFNILTPTGTEMSSVVYAIYHGRFIEMLLNHFDRKFTSVSATALPAQGDHVSG
jgi:hypothetical protein